MISDFQRIASTTGLLSIKLPWIFRPPRLLSSLQNFGFFTLIMIQIVFSKPKRFRGATCYLSIFCSGLDHLLHLFLSHSLLHSFVSILVTFSHTSSLYYFFYWFTLWRGGEDPTSFYSCVNIFRSTKFKFYFPNH
jgi:hypothetical protein